MSSSLLFFFLICSPEILALLFFPNLFSFENIIETVNQMGQNFFHLFPVFLAFGLFHAVLKIVEQYYSNQNQSIFLKSQLFKKRIYDKRTYDKRTYEKVIDDWILTNPFTARYITKGTINYFFDVTKTRIVAAAYYLYSNDIDNNNSIVLASSVHTRDANVIYTNNDIQTIKKKQLEYALARLFDTSERGTFGKMVDRIKVPVDPVTYKALVDSQNAKVKNLEIQELQSRVRIDFRRLNQVLRQILCIPKQNGVLYNKGKKNDNTRAKDIPLFIKICKRNLSNIVLCGEVTTQPIWNRNVDKDALKKFHAGKTQVRILLDTDYGYTPAGKEMIKSIKETHPSPFQKMGEGPLIKDFYLRSINT